MKGHPPLDPPHTSLQGWKLFFELGPLLVFFLANYRLGIFWGTGSFILATILSLIATRFLFGKIALMPLLTAFFITVFGGLTLFFHDDLFIKLKPTFINSIFSVVLLGGLVFGHSLLRYLFGDMLKLTDEGWRYLTFRWGIFFAFLAVMNEAVWRNFSTDTWVSFKVFGIMPLTMVFALSQIGLLKRYENNTETH
ncbi:MAG: septation protein A [Hyphomicrobium sp.]